MRTNKLFNNILLLSTVTISINSAAQITFTPQYIARGEYRHGYQTLPDSNQKPAAFISQRARLTGEYKADKYKIVVGIQDVRTWGNTTNLSIDTKGLLSVSEAYAELTPNSKIAVRVGRQILSYDDERIMGGSDWNMQARRHDLVLFKYTDSTLAIHAGAAYNQNQEQYKTTVYTLPNYKTFQYLWANKLVGKMNFSVLFLNNGYQYQKSSKNKVDSITVFSQTAGLRAVYKGEKLSGTAYGYYQFGKDATNKRLEAFCASAEASYSFVKDFFATLGGEILSGTKQNSLSNINRSFNPVFGTNHRFNGYMDYFYVGNHLNSVGLVDAYFKLNYTHKDLMLGFNTHLFRSAAAMRLIQTLPIATTYRSRFLGTELDFTIGYKLSDGASLQAGYSQLFGTNSMVTLKGGTTSETSNWVYVMLIIKPGNIKWPKAGLKM